MRDLTGQTFGSYRLEGLLGRGGMGEVYRARHLRLTGRLAAVKLLPASFAGEPDFLQRFEHEANAAASLDHPNILPVWDYGEQEGIPYLAMPLVTNGSLKDLLESRGTLTPAEAERYLTPIAEALDYAHSRGLLHRDVKPANILLRDDGRPLLADFGIAKAIEAGHTGGLTQAGGGIGTPEYMAPEQIEGRAERRSDLYSLGMALYQMLSGRVPYDGATPYEIALKQLSTPLPPIRQYRPDLSPAIEAVVTRALAKDPAGRYGTGREFAAAFREAIARPGGAAATIVDQPIVGRTTPLQRPVAAAAVAAPVVADPQRQPPPVVQGGPVASPTPRRATSWPLIAAAVVIAGLILTIGGIAAYPVLFPTPTPTPTRVPPTNTIAAAPQIGATQTAIALATASAIPPTAPPTATVTPDIGATGTTVAGATATANAIAGATASASASRASATAAASAAANATAIASATTSANATASANAASSATARVARSATAAAALTATAAAQPTVTPTPAPTNTPVPPTATSVPPTVTPTRAAPTAPPAGNWGPALAALSGGKRYSDPDDRFSLSVPTNWVQGTSGNSAVAFAPPDNSANFTVTLDRVPGNTTIDAYNAAAEQQLRSQFANYTPVSVEKVTIDGRQAYKRVSRATVQGQTIQFVQVYYLKDGVAQVLTFACLPADFERLTRIFDGIAGSYQAED